MPRPCMDLSSMYSISCRVVLRFMPLNSAHILMLPARIDEYTYGASLSFSAISEAQSSVPDVGVDCA